MRSPLNWGSLSFYSDWNGFSCLEFVAERKQSKNNGSQIIRLHVELGITDTQLSTLFLHVFTSFHYEMSKPRMRGKTGPGCLPFVPPKYTWDPPNKAGSHNLQQPERWAPWQKGRQIVCLPSDKQHWLCSTEMISNMGFCIFWPSAWHPFSCSHLWRALKIQVTHFVEISRKIQAFWTAFLFQGYTGSCNSIHNGLPWLSTESHWPRTKPCLSPMTLLHYCGQGTPASQQEADRRGMLLSHQADPDSPDWMKLWHFPAGCACSVLVLWFQSQLLQLLCHPVPVMSFLLTWFSLIKLFLKYEKIFKRYAWFVPSLLRLSMHCKTGISGVSSSCLQLIY